MSASRPSHTITPAEVKAWFGQKANAGLSEAQYRATAGKLNKFRWPSDPIKRSAKPSSDIDPYWNFRAAAKAAKLLLDATPAMIRHWQALTWAPETRDGYAATVALERTLQTALPFIEWPFGQYRRATGRKQAKPWHVPSVLVAKILAEAMVASQRSPSLERNSVLVRVTSKALQRMGYNLTNIGTSGMSAYLMRWHKRHGLIPKRNQR